MEEVLAEAEAGLAAGAVFLAAAPRGVGNMFGKILSKKQELR